MAFICKRKEHLKLDARIKEIEMKKTEELRIQCHEFEIRNFMNVIYIFYMERLRSSSQLQAIYKHFEVITYSFRIELQNICIYINLFFFPMIR